MQPTALKTIFGLDAFELNHQNISLEDIVRDAILEQLVNAISLEEKISLISSFFLKQIERVKNNHKKLVHASTLLQNGKTLKEIQLEMNLSERTLERIIKQSVGLSPKIFSRIMRFQDGLNCLRQTNFENFTELAYQYDYFDQSHYNREFKEFTGTSPSQYMLELKLNVAKLLLSTTAQSVKNISYSLNFENPEYFSVFFKKRTGITPIEYRNAVEIKK